LIILSLFLVPSAAHSQSEILKQTNKNEKLDEETLFDRLVEQLLIEPNFQEAQITAREVLDIYRQERRIEKIIPTLNLLAIISMYLGEYKQGIKYAEESLKFSQAINDLLQQITSLNNLSILYLGVGKYENSIEHLKESLEIAQKISNQWRESQSLLYLGFAYSAIGQDRKAIEFHQKCLNIARQKGYLIIEAGATLGLMTSYLRIKNNEGLSENLPRSVELSQQFNLKEFKAINVFILGKISTAEKKHQEALKYYKAALNFFESKNYQPAIPSLLREISKITKNTKNLEQALLLSRLLEDPYSKIYSFANVGLTYKELGKYGESELKLLKAIEEFESLKSRLKNNNRISFFDSFENETATYSGLQEVQIALNKPEKALETAERSRVIALAQLLAFKDSQTNSNLLEKITISQIKQIAKQEKATLVEYSLIEESKIYIWVIKPSGEIHFRQVELENNKHWQQFVEDTLRDINKNRDSQPRLKELHRILIEPIAQFLPQNPADRVIFIPQRELALIPFAALKDERGKFLIEKHTILTAPSIRVLNLTHKRLQNLSKINNTNSALIVGNPKMPLVKQPGGLRQQLSQLPNAEKEAKEIAKILNSSASIGDLATKNQVLAKLPSVSIIHFGTHASFNELNGLKSMIALTPDDDNDGFLSASEVIHLKLNAQLVVLSACNTGQGKITGDGVIGLSRSFIAAGVPSAIVSLWSVPDAPTADLMTEFYRQWQQNPDKAAALRQAMLKTMKKHPAPLDWAGFILIGQADSID